MAPRGVGSYYFPIANGSTVCVPAPPEPVQAVPLIDDGAPLRRAEHA